MDFGAGAARSRGIWLEPEPSLWPGSGYSLMMYSAPNYRDITSDQDSADRQHYPVGESYSDAKETGELYPPIQITGVY